MEDRLSEDSDDESTEDGGDKGVTAVGDKTRNVATGEKGDDGNRKSNPDDSSEGDTESVMKLLVLPFAEFFGQFREKGGRNRDADEGDGHLMKTRGLLKGTESAGTHAGGEIGRDNCINVINSLVERAGGEKFEDAEEALVFPVNLEIIIKAEAEETDKGGQELEDSAESDTDSDAHDTAFEDLKTEDRDTVGEDSDTDKDTDVIEGGGEGAEDKATKGLLNGGNDGRDREEEGVDRYNAHHVDRENHAGFVETGTDDVADERFGKNHHEDTCDKSNQSEKVQEGGGEFPGGFFIAFNQTFVKNGDKRDGESARGQNEEHEIGDSKGGSIRVDSGRVGP